MLLLLLGLLHIVQGTEPPETLRKPIDVCPTVGYFFERQPSNSTSGPCYLCYCKGDGEAVCTLRDSARCDEENSYQSEIEQTTVRRHRRRKHRRRPRRSPGMMDIFFNDAKKDQLLKGMVDANNEDCEPKSSKSIGCPPKNWCTGCLVCDCDDDHQWQCHVMSFCDDDYKTPKSKSKNKMKSKNIAVGESKKKNEGSKKEGKMKVKRRSIRQKKSNNIYKDIHKHRRSAEKTFDMTKNKTQPLISVKTRMSYITRNNASKVLVIKKYISTLSPINSPELSKYRNDPSKLAQILYQQHTSTEPTNAARWLPKEPKTTILLNNFLNKDKPKYDEDELENVREETTTKQPRLKFKRKNSTISSRRRPRNVDQFDRNRKEDLKETREKKKLSFYHKQTDLMESRETVSQVKKAKKKTKTMDKGNIKETYEQIKKNELIALASRRKKRDVVPLSIEESNYANVNEPDNEDLAPSYAYTVVDTPVSTHNDSPELRTGDKEYETTLKYDITTLSDDYRENRNQTNMTNEIYTPEQNYTTTQTSIRLANNTETFIIVTPETQENITETTTVDSDIYISTFQKPFETTTKTIHDNASDILIIPLQTEKKDFNKTENLAQNVILKDINKTHTDSYNCNLMRMIENSINKQGNNNSVPMNISKSNILKPIINNHKDLQHSKNYINKPKHHRLVPIKFLKKIYGKFLVNQNNDTNSNNFAAMESICDTFGPCQISTKNVEKIYTKINELISETKRSLNIIKTMKDVLQIIKGRNNNTDNINDTDTVEYKGYVNQLNEILTDTSPISLTETQKIYNMYAKANTTDLFDSIGKFAFILNDILKIIRSDKLKYDYINKRKNKIKQNAIHEQVRKIKNAIRKFHILQNTFMLKLYKAVSNLETSKGKTKNYEEEGYRSKTSITKYIETDTEMKAPELVFNRRKKRDIVGDNDAIDYLLTLLEYMLKLNNPLKSKTVTDGIDLLMEAIKRAPNIKPIRKSFLEPIRPVNVKFIDKDVSKSNSEDQDDNVSFLKNQTNIVKGNALSSNEQYNDTENLASNLLGEDLGEMLTELQTSKSVEVSVPQISTEKIIDFEEDLEKDVKNNKSDNAQIKTFIPYSRYTIKKQQTEEPFFKSEDLKPKVSNDVTQEISAEKVIENHDISITIKESEKMKDQETNKVVQSTAKTYTTTSNSNQQLNILNKENKKPVETSKPINKTKKKKLKLSRGKLKSKSNFRSFTKELNEENLTNKVAEDEILGKHILSSEDYDIMKSMDEESLSGDDSAFDPVNNEAFPSYFS